MITIKEAASRSELKKFVELPFKLYKDNRNWVPPIITQELDNLDIKKNPVYRDANAWFWIAYRDNLPVGRIAAIYNRIDREDAGVNKMRFGWFESVNDQKVANALFEQVYTKAKELKVEFIEGPSGFSNMDKAGLLIEGFDRIGSMTTHYNFDYYSELLENAGYSKEVDWKEFEIKVPESVPDKVSRFSKLIKEKFKLQVLAFNSNKELLPYTEAIFDLMNKSYADLPSFTPIKSYMIPHYKNKFIKYLDPEFVRLIAREDGSLVGFSVSMPSFSKALQKANGSLFPFGFYHLLKAQKKNDKATLLLIGILPEYLSKGLTAIIIEEAVLSFRKRGITYVETNPELETNAQVQALWKDYNPKLIKKWRTYRKQVTS